jgi:hypothetical protein
LIEKVNILPIHEFPEYHEFEIIIQSSTVHQYGPSMVIDRNAPTSTQFFLQWASTLPDVRPVTYAAWLREFAVPLPFWIGQLIEFPQDGSESQDRTPWRSPTRFRISQSTNADSYAVYELQGQDEPLVPPCSS